MLTAFIVDDNPGDRTRIRRLLRACSLEAIHVEEAWNIEDAVERLSTDGIDIVLLDLNLPGSRGRETVAKVRAANPDVPIIVIAGPEDQHTASGIIDHGAQGHLTKGHFDSHKLTHEILRCLDGKPGTDGLGAAG